MTSTINKTLTERGSRYGSFPDQAACEQRIKAAMAASANWNSLPPDCRSALEMFATKISRILTGDPEYADNWHGIAGYATLVENRVSPGLRVNVVLNNGERRVSIERPAEEDSEGIVSWRAENHPTYGVGYWAQWGDGVLGKNCFITLDQYRSLSPSQKQDPEYLWAHHAGTEGDAVEWRSYGDADTAERRYRASWGQGPNEEVYDFSSSEHARITNENRQNPAYLRVFHARLQDVRKAAQQPT